MIIALFILIVLALLGLPLFVVLSGLALVLFAQSGIDSSAVIIEGYRLAQAPGLVAIPLFTFAGHLMAESKTPERLVVLSQAALGWLPGGIAIVTLILCSFFTAFTGASGVTIIALGGLLYPILKEEGYSDQFALGLITTCGSLGLLFPPSLPMIFYGLVAKVDVDLLFRTGPIPGVLLIIALSLFAMAQSRKQKTQKHSFSWKQLAIAMKGARFELPLPFFVFGGIYSGLVTVNEGAAIVLFWVILMEFVLYRDLSFRQNFVSVMKESVTLVGAIFLILICALGLTNYLVDEEIPLKILDWMKHYVDSKYEFLLFLNLFLLVVGCLMDIFSAIVVVVPMLLPLAQEFNIHPLHLAIIFLTNLEIGYITPPVGINLFISSYRFKRSVPEIYRHSFPFLLVLLFCLIIITYVPWFAYD